MVIRYDMIEVKAQVDDNGFIRDKPVITRAGIFPYRARNGIVTKEYRPDEEVFADASLSSLAGIPITDGHSGLINSDNATGIIGTVTSPGAKQETNVVADIVIHRSKQIGNRRELSLGYRCDIDEAPGEYNGEKYDAIQRNIRYNHLAVVNKGRAGNARLRLDAADAVNGPFDTEDKMSETKLVTIRLDEIDYQASPEVANALKKAQEAQADLKKRFDALEAERDGLKSKVDEHKDELTKVKNTAREEIRARLELESVASQYEIKFDEADTDTAIRAKVVGKLRPTIKLDAKSDEYIASAYDIALAEDKDKNKKVTNQKQRLDHTPDNNADTGGAEAARQRMIARMRGEKKEAA